AKRAASSPPTVSGSSAARVEPSSARRCTISSANSGFPSARPASVSTTSELAAPVAASRATVTARPSARASGPRKRLSDARREASRELLPCELRGVAFGDRALGAHHFAERPVHDARAERQAAAPAHEYRLLARGERALELAQQPRLADARLAEDGDQLRRAHARHASEQRRQCRELLRAPHQ